MSLTTEYVDGSEDEDVEKVILMFCLSRQKGKDCVDYEPLFEELFRRRRPGSRVG